MNEAIDKLREAENSAKDARIKHYNSIDANQTYKWIMRDMFKLVGEAIALLEKEPSPQNLQEVIIELETDLKTIETMYNALKPVNAHLEAENKRLRELLINDEPYSLLMCLEIMAGAVEHLLVDHSCDVHGYEQYEIALRCTRKHKIAIEQTLKHKAADQTSEPGAN